MPSETDAEQNPIYFVLEQSISVSSGSSQEPVKIFWTENGFDGPRVNLEGTGIQRVNIVYNSQIPEEVADEDVYEVGGETPSGWQKQNALGTGDLANTSLIRAYNREGRVLVEYLGVTRDDDSGRKFGNTWGWKWSMSIGLPFRRNSLSILGSGWLPSDGVAAQIGEEESPDGKRVYDPQDFIVNLPDFENPT